MLVFVSLNLFSFLFFCDLEICDRTMGRLWANSFPDFSFLVFFLVELSTNGDRFFPCKRGELDFI